MRFNPPCRCLGIPIMVLGFLFCTGSLVRAQLAPRPLIAGRTAVVTSLDPLASEAGMRVLQQGGNAFDAAIATAAAVAVIDPRMSSLGGNGFATIYIAKTHEVRALNFYGIAPKRATAAFYKGKDYSRGVLSAPVPSGLRGWEALHSAYGKLPWSQVLEPAIDLARNGFVIKRPLSDSLAEKRELLASFPSSAKVFLPGGRVPQPGEIFKQPDLARTLEEIATKGADVFYKGPIAGQIADFYQQQGGIITREDLASYRALWVTPISTTYHGYTFYTQPPSSSGIAVLEQLNLLEGFPLKSMGHNSPAYLHVIGEAMRLAIADRNRYVGDPAFVNVPVAKLLSKEYARQRGSLIHLDSTMSVATAGDVDQPVESHTTHMNTVDAEGNMVALTQTLGAEFGSGVIAGNTGVLFSNEMRHLHLDANDPSRLEPGKRSRSNESPLIALKDNRPFMALGTPGNDGIWQRLVQVILNVIDFDEDIQTAITEPRMVYGGQQETGTEIKPIFDVEDRIPENTMDALRKKGYVVKGVADDIGRVNGIVIDPATGFRYGGADPREDGYAIGW
jgi:gamma-glutamyltranspeptidase / glutathione hydrolase